MPSPTEEQLDALAAGYARGLSKQAAAVAAGYSPRTSSFREHFKKQAFQDRIDKHRRALNQAETPDLVPIIERLVSAADKAAAMPTAAAMKAACDLLAEAARLKRLLPLDQAAARPRYEMTREEWLATFAPRPA
jgi:hypothetical protein